MKSFVQAIRVFAVSAVTVAFMLSPAWGQGTPDLKDIKQKGVLRHLGVPYANFVTGSGDGLDVEMVKLFATYLGVKYTYVETTWDDAIPDLIGKMVKSVGDNVEFGAPCPVKGDIVANGMTVLPWRAKAVDFSAPTLLTQIWVVARADSTLQPIPPSGNPAKDIEAVKHRLKDHSILGKSGTCLDPCMYGLDALGAKAVMFPGGLNELVPAILKGDAETTLLDITDALIALEKWPGAIKVVGPVSEVQDLGYAFRKTSPELRAAFNTFLEKVRKSGEYETLVKKYYPAIIRYYPEFFKN